MCLTQQLQLSPMWHLDDGINFISYWSTADNKSLAFPSQHSQLFPETMHMTIYWNASHCWIHHVLAVVNPAEIPHCWLHCSQKLPTLTLQLPCMQSMKFALNALCTAIRERIRKKNKNFPSYPLPRMLINKRTALLSRQCIPWWN